MTHSRSHSTPNSPKSLKHSRPRDILRRADAPTALNVSQSWETTQTQQTLSHTIQRTDSRFIETTITKTTTTRRSKNTSQVPSGMQSPVSPPCANIFEEPQETQHTVDNFPPHAHSINIVSETTPLLPQSSRTQPNFGQRLLGSFKKAAFYIYDRPVTTFLSLVSSSSAAVNAALAATNTPADKVSVSWFKALNGREKTWTITLFIASLVVNTILATLFIPSAANLFKKDSWRAQPFRNVIKIILGITAAVAMFAISVDSFAFLLPLGIAMGVASLAINFPTRAVSIGNVFDRVGRAVKKGNGNILATLSELKPKHQKVINQALQQFAEQHAELEKTDQAAFFQNSLSVIADKLATIPAQQRFAKPRCGCRHGCGNCLKSSVGKGFDYIFAGMVFVVSLMMFSQKGIDGFGKIAGAFNSNDDEPNAIETLPSALRLLIGAIAGSGSAALYFLAALDIRQTITDCIIAIIKTADFTSAISALTLAGLAGLSGPSMETVVRNIQNNSHTEPTIAGFFANVPFADLVAVLGVVAVNLKSCLVQLGPKPLMTIPKVQAYYRQHPTLFAQHQASLTSAIPESVEAVQTPPNDEESALIIHN